MDKIIKRDNALCAMRKDLPDSLAWWADQYFTYSVTSAPSSRKMQIYDVGNFLKYLVRRVGDDRVGKWIPRVSREYMEYLRVTKDPNTLERRWGDRCINRIIYHLKPFAAWVHSLRPFPLDNPMVEISGKSLGSGLEIERALTPEQREKILAEADRLLDQVGKGKRHRRR